MTGQQPPSTLTTDQWEQLHKEIFNGESEALTVVKGWAQSRLQPPVASVILAACWALSSLPAGTTFNAGMGEGSVNMLVALVGPPGQGKDSLVAAIAGSLSVSHRGREVELEELSVGSGEGMIARCQPDEEGAQADPVLFGVSEIGSMDTLMRRQGAILRPTIMSIYSGNALGVTNKSERTYVPRNSYTAGLWVGVQPDKAGALLDGPDDGLAHRFIWTELLDPTHPDSSFTVPAERLLPVVIPDDMGEGFTFPAEVCRQTRAARIHALKYGAPADHRGHRHQTRLKLAAGLALLRSSREVDADDWRRSGVLMEYSDMVRRGCLAHLEDQTIQEEAERQERRDRADDQVHLNRVKRCRGHILTALADDSSQEAVKWSPLMQARPSREREAMSEALTELMIAGAVEPLEADGRPGVVDSLMIGPTFEQACLQEGVS